MATVRIGASGATGAVPQSAVAGVFSRRRDLERALRNLERAGVGPDQVTVLSRNGVWHEPGIRRRRGPRLAGAPAVGAAIGAVAGAGIGGFAGEMAAVPPALLGLGQFPSAGLLATSSVAAIVAAVIGALVVGLVGLLVAQTIWGTDARPNADGPSPGDLLLMANAGTIEQARQVQTIVRRHGGTSVVTYQVEAAVEGQRPR
ncbi:MAG: hypothetical protein ACRDJN_29085 [Chloroflexota bacterium]